MGKRPKVKHLINFKYDRVQNTLTVRPNSLTTKVHFDRYGVCIHTIGIDTPHHHAQTHRYTSTSIDNQPTSTVILTRTVKHTVTNERVNDCMQLQSFINAGRDFMC